MKIILAPLVLVCTLVLFSLVNTGEAASARCEVVKKEGKLLVMDCGERAEGFTERSKVKIKTDRDAQQNRGK